MTSIPEAKIIFITNKVVYMSGVYYMGIKAYNHLLSYIKKLLDNKNQFKNIFKNYLLLNSYCSRICNSNY
jgi:hypothetical protein